MRYPSFEQTVPYFSLSEEAINILPVITNGDYADDINYHYFQLLHPARPCRLWGQLPAEEPPPAVVHSLAEPPDCASLRLSLSLSSSVSLPFFLLSPAFVSSSLFFSVLFLSPARCQRVQEALCTVKGRPVNERGEVEVNCGEIWDELWGNPWHRLDRFLQFPFPGSLSPHFTPLCSLFASLSLDLVAFVSPLSTLPSLLTWNIHFRPMKYGEGPHELFTD